MWIDRTGEGLDWFAREIGSPEFISEAKKYTEAAGFILFTLHKLEKYERLFRILRRAAESGVIGMAWGSLSPLGPIGGVPFAFVFGAIGATEGSLEALGEVSKEKWGVPNAPETGDTAPSGRFTTTPGAGRWNAPMAPPVRAGTGATPSAGTPIPGGARTPPQAPAPSARTPAPRSEIVLTEPLAFGGSDLAPRETRRARVPSTWELAVGRGQEAAQPFEKSCGAPRGASRRFRLRCRRASKISLGVRPLMISFGTPHYPSSPKTHRRRESGL